MEKVKYIAGIMTGTSVDAIDTCLCKFYMIDGKFKFELINYKETKIDDDVKSLIIDITNNKLNIWDFSQLNFYLSSKFRDCVEDICELSLFPIEKLDAVSIHGQTLWHQPNPKEFFGRMIGSTFQHTSVSALSALLSKTVIGDFRAADVALGGQGAPLVPVFDFYFLRNNNKNVIALNIGGISNITFLPVGAKRENITAFDCGPGNVLIDLAVKLSFDKDYDYNGEFARKGKVDSEIFSKLKMNAYINKRPPKSTGREVYNIMFYNAHFNNCNNYDILRTLTEFTAYSIYLNIKNFASVDSDLIISGGGRKNSFLVEKIQDYLPNINIQMIDDIGIDGDAKEAICFAFLGYLNLLNIPGNIKSVTGASKEVVLGIRADNY